MQKTSDLQKKDEFGMFFSKIFDHRNLHSYLCMFLRFKNRISSQIRQVFKPLDSA